MNEEALWQYIFDNLIYTKVKIAKGTPMFGTVILDSDAVVYLDIADDVLKAHCEKRYYVMIRE